MDCALRNVKLHTFRRYLSSIHSYSVYIESLDALHLHSNKKLHRTFGCRCFKYSIALKTIPYEIHCMRCNLISQWQTFNPIIQSTTFTLMLKTFYLFFFLTAAFFSLSISFKRYLYTVFSYSIETQTNGILFLFYRISMQIFGTIQCCKHRL